MSGPQILALGEPLVEFTEVDLPGHGPHYRMGYGGDISNAAIAAARQGASVGMLTALGDDMFGAGLRGLWRDEGVDAAGVAVHPDAPTGVYFVKPHASGRDFTYLRKGSAASLYGPVDLPEALIRDARLLHVSAISQAVSEPMRAAASAAIDIARGAGVKVSYDTNLRLKLWDLELARETIFAALERTDVIFPSDDEARQLTGLEDVDAMLDRFLGFGAGLVVMKMGAEGAVVAGHHLRERIPPAPSTPVDSTGAGDSFAGAFLAYLLETDDPVLAARRAARVAAGTVSGYGAIDPIPRREAIIQTEDTP
ncbi:sugar kinase [Rhodobacteraceae bacterium 2CG4]|uniref:Sugar kinase n=1 Tax=Halovulum marinum TaxID=2662447 RepID=A0A6L5YXU2_9RHOB|nr:sugar kinase [Halovulum marinum]MSU88770.1 sugar kinase [Halovulum marinum]